MVLGAYIERKPLEKTICRIIIQGGNLLRIYYEENLIETFIFDLDGTAFGYSDCVASINAEGKVLDYICSIFEDIKIEEVYQLLNTYMDVDRKKCFKDILQKINHNKDINIDLMAEDLETLYWVTFSQLNTPYSDFIYYIEKIKPYCKLAVMTDGYIRNQKIKIFSSGLHKYFDFKNVVFSDEINAKKPSCEIFDYALHKIGFNPQTTAYIGDSLEKDIAGANNAGIIFSTYLKRGSNVSDIPKDNLQNPRITITSYYELAKRLEIK